ncbi:MAG: tRNA (N(6)-L-threonylcarbamoyladenosine(37)-C(2))-methylthiotransferase MtaB, partial [Hyphomicrobiaceae bacterium]
RQARQTIRKARRDNPGARIIVTGCAAQIDPGQFSAMDEVDHVIGNAEKTTPHTFHALAAGDLGRVQVNDIMAIRESAPHMLDGFGTRARAYVQIQNGCDHRCTFCIIPYGRGPSRSVAAGEVVAQVRRLVEDGIGEVVLTGVDITSYGTDLPGAPSLGWLVRQILRHVPELARLRLSSIDQVEVDRHLMDAIADEPRLMPHLHLSMQAGSDLILKRMKRRHLRADAIGFCREVRRLRPGIALGADLIAGFPTETAGRFEDTMSLVDECGLVYLHVFPFSPRPGTPAARMPQLPRAEIKARAARLRQKADDILAAWLADQVGERKDVVVEQAEAGRVVGRTPHYAQIVVQGAGDAVQPGSLMQAKVSGSDGARLQAEAST